MADSVVYNSMINACAKAGDIDRADHWLERMLEADVPPDIIEIYKDFV